MSKHAATTDTDSLPKKDIVYCTVKFNVGWLPGAVALTEAAKTVLAAELGIDKRVIRGNYAILGASLDPLIKEGAALKRLMVCRRNEYTIPECTVVAAAGNPDEFKIEKVAGSYLIEACKVEEFLEKFNDARAQYLAWGKRVSEPANYNRLREADKKALGKDWAVVEPKYPSAAQMADAVSCDLPRIEPFNASFTLADVAPATAKMLREQAEARLAASVDGAVGELVFEFQEMVAAVAKNCGKRVRLLPNIGHAKQDLRYAEVQQILRHEDNAEVPKGSVLVTVQRCAAKEGKTEKLIQVGKAEDMLMTETAYKELRPYETEEYRSLAQSSFDNLIWLATKIQSVRTMLGTGEGVADLTALAEEVSAALGNMGGSAAEITKQLKSSSFARAQAKATFQGFMDKLSTQIESKVKAKGPRRKIKLGGGGAEE